MTQGPVTLEVSVSYALPRAGLPSAVSFRKWVAAALKGRIRDADLAVRIVDTQEGRALNRHYRGKDYATNVLSFPAEPAEGVKMPKDFNMPLLGDLVTVSYTHLDVYKRQSGTPQNIQVAKGCQSPHQELARAAKDGKV